MNTSLQRGTTHIFVPVHGFMINKKQTKIMVLNVDYKYEDGEKSRKVGMKEKGRVKEDGEYF